MVLDEKGNDVKETPKNGEDKDKEVKNTLPAIIISKNEKGVTFASWKNCVSREQILGMLEEAKIRILAKIEEVQMRKIMEDEALRQEVAGGKNSFQKLRGFLGKKH